MEKLNTLLLVAILIILAVLAFNVDGSDAQRYTMHLDSNNNTFVLDTKTGLVHTFTKGSVAHIDLIRGDIRWQSPVVTPAQHRPAQ